VAEPSGAKRGGDLSLIAHSRYPMLAIETGEIGTTDTSAEDCRPSSSIARRDGRAGWVQVALAN
jgi:hypothetical protein